MYIRSEVPPRTGWRSHAARGTLTFGPTVGKPTLRQDEPKPLLDLLTVRSLGWPHFRDRPRQAETMPGPNHRRDRFFALPRVVERAVGERPEPPLLRKPQRGRDGVGVGKLARSLAVALVDTRDPKRLDHASLA